MEKLLIVDGSNLLFQMFYGMPAQILNGEGKAIQGTLGFVGALLKIIRMVEPTHVAVLFDGPCENERKAMDERYKANRPDYSRMPEEETPFSQLPDIYAALDYLGICHEETACCEADDWIAGYALALGSEMEIVISSFDSDFFQLITDHVRILRYRGSGTAICDREYLKKRYDIEPGQYVDFKSLVGDAADNIRGANRVGPKTAAWLLREYGSLDGVIAGAASIRKPSVRESVMNSIPRLQLNRRMIQLHRVEELPFSPDEMRYEYDGTTTMEVLRGIGLR